jgi:hypothetical protein
VDFSAAARLNAPGKKQDSAQKSLLCHHSIGWKKASKMMPHNFLENSPQSPIKGALAF